MPKKAAPPPPYPDEFRGRLTELERSGSPKSWQRSSSRRPRRSATGFGRPISMMDVAAMD